MVVWFFLEVLWVCLWFVIVVFPDHTHLIFLRMHVELLDKIHDSSSVLEAFPGKLEIKRHSPSILYRANVRLVPILMSWSIFLISIL